MVIDLDRAFLSVLGRIVDPMQAEDILILQIESRFYRHAGSKWAAVRAELGLDPVGYSQRLNRLADDPEALLLAPVVVRRVQRLRARRMVSKRAS